MGLLNLIKGISAEEKLSKILDGHSYRVVLAVDVSNEKNPKAYMKRIQEYVKRKGYEVNKISDIEEINKGILQISFKKGWGNI